MQLLLFILYRNQILTIPKPSFSQLSVLLYISSHPSSLFCTLKPCSSLTYISHLFIFSWFLSNIVAHPSSSFCPSCPQSSFLPASPSPSPSPKGLMLFLFTLSPWDWWTRLGCVCIFSHNPQLTLHIHLSIRLSTCLSTSLSVSFPCSLAVLYKRKNTQ